jgi:hypothetical protein
LPRSRQSREDTLSPARSCIHISPKWNLSQMGPLVFGQYADECLYLTKLVMIFGPLEMLSKLQLHLWSAREGGCALHLRKARGTVMVHSLDALRGESK